jgi:hypothetical protein
MKEIIAQEKFNLFQVGGHGRARPAPLGVDVHHWVFILEGETFIYCF